MAATALTKSYVDAQDPQHPVQEDLVMYDHFEKARSNGVVGEFVSLEKNRRATTTEILEKADEYAKGMLAIGLTPGEDTLAVIGCSTLEATNLYVACTAISVGYAHPYIYSPQNISFPKILFYIEPRAVVIGEGEGGSTCSTFLDFYEESSGCTSCEKLPFIEHIFYDNSYNDRSPAHKCLKPLSQLIQLGSDVTDEQLKEAKSSVKPECILHHVFSSGSTGQPKCIAHTHRGLANELLQLREDNLEPVMVINPNTDDVFSYSCISCALAGKISKLVIQPEFVSRFSGNEAARLFTQAISDEGVQYLCLPASVTSMVSNYVELNNIDFPALKILMLGGQIVTRGFKDNLKQNLKGSPFTLYGMSETHVIGFCTLGVTEDDEEARMESRLHPKPNTKLRIVDGNNEILDIGKDGEIQVQTYSRLKEYRKQEQLTKDLFTDDGFLKIGDMGVMHPDGTFVIKGRIADAMRFKVLEDVVYPAPIEEVMSNYPGIADILVVSGYHSDVYGDEVTYCIRLSDGTVKPTEEQLISHIFQNGCDESHKPCRVIYIDKFPTTANQRKVSKALLRAEVKEMIEKDAEVGLCDWYKQVLSQISTNHQSSAENQPSQGSPSISL